MKFLVFNRKKIIVFLIVAVLFLSFLIATIKISYTSSSPKTKITIAIDAGHGGRDGGCVGVETNVKESDLALAITKKIEKYLTIYGFNVVLTRKNENGLYGEGKNKKLQDMEVRKKIINENASDCVISIHLNSFSSQDARGAQAFFTEGDVNSQKFSTAVQEQLALQIPKAKQTSKTGDFYMLKCREVPSILVECGYLSNPEEERLLITGEYQEKIAYAIFCGTLKFFNVSYQ